MKHAGALIDFEPRTAKNEVNQCLLDRSCRIIGIPGPCAAAVGYSLHMLIGVTGWHIAVVLEEFFIRRLFAEICALRFGIAHLVHGAGTTPQ